MAEREEEEGGILDKKIEEISAAREEEQKAITEPEPEEDYDHNNKYMLLDHLFKFVHDDEPLNAVLSGYFSKLVSLLIQRRQKQLIPYIYAPTRIILDQLVHHVAQKSISELLAKLLFISDFTDYEEVSAPAIIEKQN